MEHIKRALEKRGIPVKVVDHEATGEEVLQFFIDGVEYIVSEDPGRLHINVYDESSTYFIFDPVTGLTRVYGSAELPEVLLEAL